MVPKLVQYRYSLIAIMLVAIIAAVAVGMYRFEKSELEKTHEFSLQAVLSGTHNSLVEWVENQRREATLWASSGELVGLTKELLAAKKAGKDLTNVEVQDRIRTLLQNQIAQRGYRGFFLIAADGVNIASTRSQNIGARNLLFYRSDVFRRMLSGDSVLTLPQPSDVSLIGKQGKMVTGYPTMFVGAPIRDDAGHVIAALTFRIDPAGEFSNILKRGRTGLSGETYAFDRTGLMVSESRFESQLEASGLLKPGQTSILTLELLDPGVNLMAQSGRAVEGAVPRPTHMAQYAIDGDAGINLSGYRDYRGVPVIGAWLWDETYGLGITTEVDVAEAYAPLRHAQVALFFLAGLSSVLMVVLAFYGYRNEKRAKVEAAKLLRSMDEANRARVEAEEATKLKDRFVSLIAHDLRNPLGAIRGFAELSLDDTNNPLDEQNRTFLGYIFKQSNELLDLISSLLDLSKLQTGKVVPNLHFLDAHFIAEDIIHRLQPQALPKNITLLNDVPKRTRIYVDAQLYAQVLQNLLTNAIKFSHEDGVVRLYVPEGAPTTLAVRDQGVGIPEAAIEKLFRIEEKTSTVGTAGESGTGFGLPLSRQIVQAHDGGIRIESVEGRGSTFFADLPQITPTVLVVDDDEDVRELINAYLMPEKVIVHEAENGREALDYIGRHDLPHLIISDINMPKMDGTELLKTLRDTFGEGAVPVIVLTGEESEDIRDQCLRLGAADFTHKPIVPQDFMPRVRQFIG